MVEHVVLGVDAIIACQVLLGSVDYLLTVVAPNTEAFQAVMDALSQRVSDKFDFTTFPVAKQIKAPHGASLLTLLKGASSSAFG
jgi:hypothetical protein